MKCFKTVFPHMLRDHIVKADTITSHPTTANFLFLRWNKYETIWHNEPSHIRSRHFLVPIYKKKMILRIYYLQSVKGNVCSGKEALALHNCLKHSKHRLLLAYSNCVLTYIYGWSKQQWEAISHLWLTFSPLNCLAFFRCASNRWLKMTDGQFPRLMSH